MGTPEETADPKGVRTTIINPTSGTITVSMGTPIVTAEAVIAARLEADSASSAGWIASSLGMAASVASGMTAFLATDAAAPSPSLSLWVGFASAALIPLGGTAILQRQRRAKRRLASIEKVSRNPIEIKDPVVRRLVEEIATVGPYPLPANKAKSSTVLGYSGPLPA